MRIYRVINNNNQDNRENNILLKFLVAPKLYDECDIFYNCLEYDNENDYYYSYSEAGYDTLECAVDRLRDKIVSLEERDRRNGSDTNREYIERARKVVDVLDKELNEAKEAEHGYYYMFIV